MDFFFIKILQVVELKWSGVGDLTRISVSIRCKVEVSMLYMLHTNILLRISFVYVHFTEQFP